MIKSLDCGPKKIIWNLQKILKFKQFKYWKKLKIKMFSKFLIFLFSHFFPHLFHLTLNFAFLSSFLFSFGTFTHLTKFTFRLFSQRWCQSDRLCTYRDNQHTANAIFVSRVRKTIFAYILRRSLSAANNTHGTSLCPYSKKLNFQDYRETPTFLYLFAFISMIWKINPFFIIMA